MNCSKFLSSLFLVSFVLLLSCSENKEAVEELKVYYDLDSVLDSSVLKFYQEGLSVDKSVTMDGSTEAQTLSPDSAGWETEFAIIRDFDLNKPYNVGAYTTTEESGSIHYVLTDSTVDAPVKFFNVSRSEGEVEITSEYFEDKSIYQHRRKLRLVLKEGLLTQYEISGFQKMIMKDTIRYRIAGDVKM